MSDVSPELLVDTVTAYIRTAAIEAAIGLKLFTHLGEGADAPTLARATGASERGVAVLCDYLTSIGFLTKDGAAYAPTPSTAVFLDERSRGFLGSIATFLAAPAMKSMVLGDPVAFVRAGGARGEANVAPENPVWVTYAEAMLPFMGRVAAKTAALVAHEKPDVRKVLDIAAGHGAFGIEVLKLAPQAEVVALDWPNVLEVAKAGAARAGVAERFTALAGSAFDVDLGRDYDLILLPNFLHHFDEATNVALLKRCHAALRPGGEIAVVEYCPHDSRVSPPVPTMFAFLMLATTPHGTAYTAAEIARMLAQAGFGAASTQPIVPTPQTLVTARA